MEPYVSKTRLSVLAKLRLKKHRDEAGVFTAEGEKCVEELIGCFGLESLLVRDTDVDLLEKYSFAPYRKTALLATPRQMSQLSAFSTPSPVMAVFRRPNPATPEIKSDRLYLMLDDIQDPGNLGTIVRTADWFGIDTIFASPHTVDVFNPKCVQSTMGALARVNVIYTELEPLLERYCDIPLYGTLLDGENIYESELSENGFIIMGNEGKGISDRLRRRVTHKLRIPDFAPPGSGCSESLNVAIATAITISEFRRRIS